MTLDIDAGSVTGRGSKHMLVLPVNEVDKMCNSTMIRCSDRDVLVIIDIERLLSLLVAFP